MGLLAKENLTLICKIIILLKIICNLFIPIRTHQTPKNTFKSFQEILTDNETPNFFEKIGNHCVTYVKGLHNFYKPRF